MINIDLENGLLKPVPSCLLLTSVTLVLTENNSNSKRSGKLSHHDCIASHVHTVIRTGGLSVRLCVRV